MSYSGSSAHPVAYTYDAGGNRTGMSDASGTSSYIYDPFGELTSAVNGAVQTTGYGYGKDGQLTSITYPLPATATWATSDTVTYAYGHSDQLTSVTDFNGNKISISYTADLLPSTVTLAATGDTISTTYDDTDTPSSIALQNGSTTLQSFTYSDSPAGTILSETDTPSSAQSPAVYTYDAKSRVTSMTPGTGSTLNYSFDASSNLVTLPTGATGTYDKAGELTSSTLSGTTTSYTYNADGQRLTATQGGNTTASATWNGAGQLTAYNNNAANMSTATYDGTGHRVSTTITPSGGTATTQEYVWNGDQMIMDGTNAYIYTSGYSPAEQVNLTTGAVTFLSVDLLGSVRGGIDATGNLTARTSYDAWGNPQTTGGISATTPFGYAGGYTEPSGLIYLVNRYYDPNTGQFLSVDPLLSVSHPPFQYTSGDPVLHSDPSGLIEYHFNDPNGCLARVDQPHFSTSVPGAVKVNGGIVACRVPPDYGVVTMQLWKVGGSIWGVSLEAQYTVDSLQKPFVRANSGRYRGRYELLNQGAWRRCVNYSAKTTFFGSVSASATESNGITYSVSEKVVLVWTAYCYTRS